MADSQAVKLPAGVPPPPPGFFPVEAQGASPSLPPGVPPPPPGFFPIGHQPANLPDVSNAQLASTLPYVGGAIGGILAPEGVLIGMGASALGGMLGKGAEQALTDKPIDPKEIALSGLEQGATELGGRGVQWLLGKTLPTAERFYQSALKPALGGKNVPASKINEIVRTGIQERIVPSEAGMHQARGIIDDINAKILEGIQARKDLGLEINANDVVRRLDSLKERYQYMDDPKPYLEAIDAARRKFLEAHTPHAKVQPIRPSYEPNLGVFTADGPPKNVQVSPNIPIERAQRIKQVTGRELRYGQRQGIDEETSKGIVRGLKEEIEGVFPEIRQLNDRERRVINLEGALGGFVKREGNHQMTGIGTPLAMTGVGVATGNPMLGMEAGLLRAALEHPPVKARIAFALDTWRKSKAGRAIKSSTVVLNPQNAVRAIGAWMPPPPPPGQ